MMLAAQLDRQLFDVAIYERNAAPGRKFLVAGKGGFNLTHGEALPAFIRRYTPSSFLEEPLSQFSNSDLRHWLDAIGIPTYVGTSSRVFPVKGIKPIEVLNAVLKHLKDRGVVIHAQHEWKGFGDDNSLLLDTPAGHKKIKADIIVFALGGGSWKVTGSNGSWADHFRQKGIECIPFMPSNCAFGVQWPRAFIEQVQGQALKNCIFRCGALQRKGEAVLTAFGIEGSGVYALSPEVRDQLAKHKQALLRIDLKPGLSEEEIYKRIVARGRSSLSKCLEASLKLSPLTITMLKALVSKDDFTQADSLAKAIKNFPVTIYAMAPVDDAISTAGGISLGEIDADFELKKLPGHYAIGEMLDWDAPTGGYLLQACFSMGFALAQQLNKTGHKKNG